MSKPLLLAALLAALPLLGACGGGGSSSLAPLGEGEEFTVDTGDPPVQQSPGVTESGPADLLAARTRWDIHGPSHYRFTQQWTAYAPPELTEPVVVEARDGVVLSRTYERTGLPVNPAYAPQWRSVEGLFQVIHDAYDRGAASVQVTYDAALGYPTSAHIDNDLGMADDEIVFTTRDLAALP